MAPDNYHTSGLSARNRSVWFLVLTAVILLGLLFGIRIYVDYTRTVNDAEERLLTQTKVVDQNLTTNLTVINLMLDNVIKKLGEISDPDQLNGYLKNQLVMTPLVRTVNVIDRQGRCVYSNREELPGMDLSHRDYFKIPRDASDKGMLFLSSPYTTSSGAYVINITKPLLGKQGEFEGIVTIVFAPEYFTKILMSTIYAPDNRVSMVHSDGTVFIAVPEARIAVTGQKVAHAGSAFLQHMNGGTPTSIHRSVGRTLGDKRVFAYLTNIPETLRIDRHIVVAASRNLDEMLAPWWMDSGISLALYLLFASLSMVTTRIMLLRRSELKQLDETQTQALEIEDLYNFAPCGYHSLDHEGTFVRINDTELKWLGYDRDEVVGKMKAVEIHTPESRAVFAKNFPQFKQGREISDLRLHFIRKDGSHLPVLLNATPIMDDNGDYLMSRSTIYDISDLVKAEESIRRLNRIYLTLSETGKAIAHIPGRDELFQEICRIAVVYGGFRMAWVGIVDSESGAVRPVAVSGSGTDYLEHIRISARSEPEGLGPTGKVIRNGGHYVCNDFMADPCTIPWRPEAEKRGFHASASLAVTMHGTTIGAMTIYAAEREYFDPQIVDLLVQMQTDISFALDNIAREEQRQKTEQALREETMERLRAVEALREQEQRFQQQSRLAAMGEMINNIAHQWRQPLNVLGLLIQRLQLCYDTGRFNKQVLDDNIDKSMDLIHHMSRTIDDFRNFFKPDKEKVEFPVREVVARTVSLVEDGFKNQHIRIDTYANADPVVFGFANEYSQVLLNILMNARDAFLEQRSGNATVTITITGEGGKGVVTIADNAGGIPEEIMSKIFEPYFTTKGPDKGTGVGLFMSKNIIEKSMNGTLTVRNTAVGAEFRVEV